MDRACSSLDAALDSYLEIAKKVLADAKRPLNSREILKAAYRRQIVPEELFGKTQQKTLQARLSTDILRSRSEFYRTAPGRFFLRRFKDDASVPAPIRREYVAPSRAGQLGKFVVPALGADIVQGVVPVRTIELGNISDSAWTYVKLHEARKNPDLSPLEVIVCFVRNGSLLLLGSGKEGHDDTLPSIATFGLRGILQIEDRSLFATDPFGVYEAAFRTIHEHIAIRISPTERPPAMTAGLQSPVIAALNQASGDYEVAVACALDCSKDTAIVSALAEAYTVAWQTTPFRANDLSRFDLISGRIAEDSDLQCRLTSAR